MKFVRFSYQDKTCYGLLEGDSVREIVGDIFGEWKEGGALYRRNSVRLLAPVDPPNIIAIGVNYRGHAKESSMEAPTAPVVFLKATTSLHHPDMPILLPKMAPDEVDYEAELVVVISKACKNVKPEKALDYVLGYTCGNDVSARDCQLRLDKQWARGKSFDTFCPLGPVIETELTPGHCRVISRVNGRIMQDDSTENLIFGIRELVSYLSQNMTLLPGTVIMTGTPEGVGFARRPPLFLRAGDMVEVEIEGIGVLRNTVEREM